MKGIEIFSNQTQNVPGPVRACGNPQKMYEWETDINSLRGKPVVFGISLQSSLMDIYAHMYSYEVEEAYYDIISSLAAGDYTKEQAKCK